MRHLTGVMRRYASAIFNLARREGSVDAVERDLRSLSAFLAEYPRVMESMTAPRIPAERKKAALRELIGNRLEQPLTRRFLDLLIDNRREELLPGAADAFALLAEEARGAVTAHVTAAAPVDEARAARLKERLDAITGKDTRLEWSIDETLLGGITVRIGDTILDGSARGYLEQFGTTLRGAPVTTPGPPDGLPPAMA